MTLGRGVIVDDPDGWGVIVVFCVGVGVAVNVGVGPDRGFAKVRYRITEKELQDKLLLEKEIIRARLKQEMRHNTKSRDIDADWIVR